jgi:predicted esterase
VGPTASHTHTFILLHGLDSNGEKFGHELLENERQAGISSSNIIFGGLSNGCAMSLICVIALGSAVGGFLGLSG